MKIGLRLLTTGAPFILLTLTTVTALQAQGFGRGGRGGENSLRLLEAEPVQKDLNLTADQKTAISKLADEQADVPREQRQQKMAETKQKLAEILQPEQQQRLEQIGLQVLGARALIRPDVIEKLGITKDQKDQLYDLIPAPPGFGGGFGGPPPGGDTGGAKGGAKGGDKGGDKGGPGGAPRMAREEMMSKAMEILTPEQRDQFEKMEGKKFDFDPAQFRGGRGPGGAGGAAGAARPGA